MQETNPATVRDHSIMPSASPLDEAVAMLGITKRFGPVVANDNISFVANKGEVHALVVENGAGKSALMSILAGLYRPNAGELRVGGVPLQLKSRTYCRSRTTTTN